MTFLPFCYNLVVLTIVNVGNGEGDFFGGSLKVALYTAFTFVVAAVSI